MCRFKIGFCVIITLIQIHFISGDLSIDQIIQEGNRKREIEIRLIGGVSELEGRVEIRYNSTWGTVCDNGFNRKAAKVVCHMLGYRRRGAIPYKQAAYGEGKGQVWLDKLSCRGNEKSLRDCHHLPWGSHNCGHKEDAGVKCQKLPEKKVKRKKMVTIELDMVVVERKRHEIFHREKSNRTIKDPSNHWNKDIYYEIGKGIDTDAELLIRDALDEWESYSCLNFSESKDVFNEHNNQIVFTSNKDDRGCASIYVGMKQGSQEIHIAKDCLHREIILHEVGHALGLHHEHNRADRDKYIKIHNENIEDGFEDQFQKRPKEEYEDFYKLYDYKSIMHYGQFLYSRNESQDLITIETLKPEFQDIIGKAKHPSFLDYKDLNDMFGCSTSCGDDVQCPAGGFLGRNCHCYCEENAEEKSVTLCAIQNDKPEVIAIVRKTKYVNIAGETASLECYAENVSGRVTLLWSRATGLPSGSSQDNGILTIPNVQPSYAGNYVCTGTDADSGRVSTAIAVLEVEIEDDTQCRNPLGMESGDILDKAITASSSYSEELLGPENARIRTETNGGAWCPKSPIDRYSYEYLQIDLGRLTVITMVEIQGRFNNGLGTEFTEEFILEYQREDDGEWLRFRNKRGGERFVGNSNTYIAEVRDVSPPIIGKRLRFIPFCRKSCTACLKVELYGCTWQDGIVTYSVRQGDRLGTEVNLVDFIYDGVINQNYLRGGLGQLTDGEKGETNFYLDTQDLGIKGYEWVGWKNDAVNGAGPVELLFQFNTVRNFTSVMLHCNNYFSKSIRVFKTAVIHYSIGGKYFEQKKDEFHYLRDSFVEYARDVRVGLDNIIARYIRLELYLDAKWLLISEVKFESKPAIGNFSAELPPTTTVSTTTTQQNSTAINDLETVVDPNSSASTLDPAQCRKPLGMESGDILDQAITASSSYDKAVGPENARVRTGIKGGAWCPKSSVDRYSYEYLQIDLGRLTVITMVEIQGRFGNGQGTEFTEEFILEYQRDDDDEWLRFRNKRGGERFVGNSNTYIAEVRDVSPPIIGKRLRFIPYCRKSCTVCLRVELYGCPWQEPAVGNFSAELPPPTTVSTKTTQQDYTKNSDLVTVVDLNPTGTSLDPAQCRKPLGMESGDIPDRAITASSSFSDEIVGPENARIRTETKGGAWCPARSINNETYEYLQIDLGNLTAITMVETQGRFGNGQGKEYTEEFLLEYQRDDNGEWIRFRNKSGEELFEGNDNTYSTEVRQVSPPIVGKRLRFIPYCRELCTVCLRVELYGCTWSWPEPADENDIVGIPSTPEITDTVTNNPNISLPSPKPEKERQVITQEMLWEAQLQFYQERILTERKTRQLMDVKEDLYKAATAALRDGSMGNILTGLLPSLKKT